MDEEETTAQNAPVKPAGPQVIAAHLKTLTNAPGVYRMFDEDGNVLYVGKARSLKKRVQAYTKMGGHTNRIARMISLTVDMEFVTTASETEALLLEANLIKQLKPKFNVILRDDKSFPYILVRRDHDVPQVLKHRGARSKDGEYFGPFASADAVNKTLNTLQRAFLLRSCSDSTYESRTRACLLYQIKRCSAPCTGDISAQDYGRLVDESVAFLKGKSRKMQDGLKLQMETAAEDLDFERAAIIRDRLRALSHIHQHQGINPATVVEADVVSAYQASGQTCIQVFFFRGGQNWGNRAYFPRHDSSHDEADVLDAFLAQFYDNKPAPKQILISHKTPQMELLGEALTVRAEHKIEVLAPQRGEKRQLVEHAMTNAREAHGRRLAESASQRKLLEGVADTFDLEAPPARIEVYDNSHIQGSHPVGGMIVAGPEGFEKGQYRKFNIKDKDITPGDDYGMMREVLTRRFSRLLKEVEKSDKTETVGVPAWPDLVLIDGGAGQLSIVQEVFGDLGVEDVTLVSIAKGPDRDAGREKFFMPGRAPFMIDPKSPVLYYLQRLRDEAHRFAIGSHRARRKKAIGSNPLDEISGIGARRKKALLSHFGSARAVSNAALADLETVDGISKSMAQRVHDFFRENT